MKNGVCLKCGAAEVHHAPKGSRLVWRSGRSTFGDATCDTYVCVKCGYFERYVSLRGDDPRRVDDIKANWKKVPVAPDDAPR